MEKRNAEKIGDGGVDGVGGEEDRSGDGERKIEVKIGGQKKLGRAGRGYRVGRAGDLRVTVGGTAPEVRPVIATRHLGRDARAHRCF